MESRKPGRDCQREEYNFVVQQTTTPSFTRDPDVQLMLRVKDGDESAFAQLVKKYQDRLVGIFANMFGGDTSLAEDLAQEVFLRIYRARLGYEPTAKFSTWVFQIASNLASNSRRAKGRKKEVQFSHESGSQPLPKSEQQLPEKSALMPTRQLDRTELQERVQAAMEMLNERQRIAVLLHRFEGMSYNEIAESMELSTQAVKSLLSRAREKLREVLEGYIT